MSKKIFKIPCGVWWCNVWVVAGHPEERADKLYSDKIFKCQFTSTHPPGTFEACVVRTDYRKGVVIWFEEENPDNSIILHESIHAAWHILDMAGVPLSKENQEPLTYLTEYIFRGIEEKMKKQTKPPKRKGRAAKNSNRKAKQR